MIIDVVKILFVGMEEEKATFFQKAQDAGCIEFIHPNGKKRGELPKGLQDTLKALKILKKQPLVKQHVSAPDVDFAELVDEVLRGKELHDQLDEKVRYLNAEIARIEPLGHFDIEEVHALERATGLRVQFFCIKSNKRPKVDLPEELIFLRSDFGMDYFISMAKHTVSSPHLFEIHIEQSLKMLENEREDARAELRIVHAELKELAAYISLCNEYLIDCLNIYHLEHAKSGTEHILDETMFAVEAWVPKTQLEKLKGIADGLGVYYDATRVEETDFKPTHMENRGLSAVGEDLVHIYDTPAPTDKDPSLWVLWAFALFFAMIVSDAGYGLLYLLGGSFMLLKNWKKEGMIKRFGKLIVMVGCFCVAWGILTGSYFGINFSPEAGANKISALHFAAQKKADFHIKQNDETYKYWVKTIPALQSVKSGQEFVDKGVLVRDGVKTYPVMDEYNDNILMEFSILIGVIHICLSFMRYALREWSSIGWIAAVIGGYLYFPSMIGATSLVTYIFGLPHEVAKFMGFHALIAGVVWAAVAALIQHGKAGLEEVTKAIQIFSDVLSYLRLYALGLAGMMLASTFNTLGMQIAEANYFILGGLVILLGHITNIVIGIMGGVIHGLRLNFLEWYHYSFEGGGSMLKPLKRLNRSLI